MIDDLPERLRQAAGPLPALDDATFERLTRRQRHPGPVMAVVCIAVLLIGAGAWGVLGGEGGLVLFAQEPAVDEPQPPAAPDSTRTEPSLSTPATVPETRLTGDEWEVMEVGQTSGQGSRVITDQARMDAAWDAFEMDGAAPVLPSGQGALILAVAGECDDASQVHGIEWIPALHADGVYAAVHIDAGCAFLERLRGVAPPRTLYVIGTPVEQTHHLEGVAAVTAPVVEFDSQLLAAVPDPDPDYLGAHLDGSSQDGLNATWHGRGLDGPPPTLPDGWYSWIVRVPGTCTDESQIRVEPRGAIRLGGGNSGNPTVFPAVLVDPACAQMRTEDSTDTQPGTLFVVAVPQEVAEALDGHEVFIDCRGTDGVGACDGSDAELVPVGWSNYLDVGDPRADPDGPVPDATDTADQPAPDEAHDVPFRLGVVGDCDDAPDIRTVLWSHVPDDGPDFAELAAYDDCAFVERFGTVVDPSRNLYVIGDSSVRDVPAGVIDQAVGFATVTEPVTPMDWQVLAVLPDAGYPPLLGMTATNQDSLEMAWGEWGPVGHSAPALPAGHDVLLVPVPGTCTDPSQIRGVNAVGAPTDPADPLFAAVYVDPACAEVTTLAELAPPEEQEDQSVTLYAISVPAGTVDTAMFGPGAFIDCRDTDSVGACAPTDAELIHTQGWPPSTG